MEEYKKKRDELVAAALKSKKKRPKAKAKTPTTDPRKNELPAAPKAAPKKKKK